MTVNSTCERTSKPELMRRVQQEKEEAEAKAIEATGRQGSGGDMSIMEEACAYCRCAMNPVAWCQTFKFQEQQATEGELAVHSRFRPAHVQRVAAASFAAC